MGYGSVEAIEMTIERMRFEAMEQELNQKIMILRGIHEMAKECMDLGYSTSDYCVWQIEAASRSDAQGRGNPIWVPVKEGLPEFNRPVLVAWVYTNHKVKVVHYDVEKLYLDETKLMIHDYGMLQTTVFAWTYIDWDEPVFEAAQ